MVSRAILNGWPLVPPSKAVSAPVFTVQPSISGTFAVGSTLTVSIGTITGFPTPSPAIQWLRNGAPIPNATGSTYQQVSADLGTRIDVDVTASNGSGSTRATATGNIVAVASGAADLFIIASQSNLEALGTDPSFNGGTPIYPAGYTAPDPLIQIWNRGTHSFETYQPFVNSAGSSSSTTWGPEYAFAKAWQADNPGKTCYILKRSQGSTGLAADATQTDWAKSTGELYADVTTIVTEAKAALTASGKTPTVQYCMSRVGEQDAKDSTKAANYATNLANWIASSRTDWGYTRHCLSMLHVEQLQSGFPNWAQVRAGQKSVADGDQNVEIVITDGATFVDQTLHLNPASVDKMGRDFYWTYSKGWTKFPWTGVGALADYANQRYVYPFVAGDISTLKSGTRENVLSVTATSTTQRGYTSSLGQFRTDLAAGVSRLTWSGGRAQLIIEPTIANRALSSRDLTISPWVLTNVTATKDQSGIDNGLNTATRLTATAANATALQPVTDASSKSRVFHASVKRITGTGNIDMMVDGVATPIAVTTTATRFYVFLTASTSPTIGFRLATSGDEIMVDYVMLEDGTFATTPFNSGSASPATRNLEDIRLAATAFTQAAGATFVMKGPSAPNTGVHFIAADTKKLLYRAASNTALLSENDAGQFITSNAGSGGYATGYGIAIAGDANGRKICFNGGAVVSDANAIATRATSNPRFGMIQNSNATTAIGAPVDLMAVFPTANVSDAQLQALAVPHVPV